jgi:hypothetical protein
MVRTQILLTAEQAEALRELAAREGRSMADLVRTGVDALLRQRRGVGRDELKRRSLAALGRFDSGLPDVGTRHDDHLTGAFGK